MTSSPVTPPDQRRRRLILAVLVFSQLLIWLDNTILGTALETLADPVRGLGASPGQLQWAVGAYTLVFATLMFSAGAIGDRYGHRRILAAGMVLFGAASVWAAYAGSAGELIAARAAMGAGSALVVPATLAILTTSFTGPSRAAAFGVFTSTAGAGVAAGPVLAGLLLDRFWWGSVFLVNLPVVVIALVGIRAWVPEFRSPRPRRLDPAGLVLSVAGLGVLAYGLIRAGQVTSWAGTGVWLPILAGLVLLAAFVLVELRVRAPSFDPRLLRQRPFGGGNLALGLLFFAMTAGFFYAAFYLQGVRGYSPLAAGVAALPAAAGVMIAGPLSTQLVRRWTVRPVATAGLLGLALCMALFALFGPHTPIVWNELLGFGQGLSVGLVIAPVTSAVMATLPLDRVGAGSAVNNTIRQTGSVLGIAVGGTVMSIVYRHTIRPALAGTPGPVRRQAETSAELARHAAAATGRPDLSTAADRAFLHAMHVTTLTTAGVALLGAIILLATFRRATPATPAAPTAPATVPERAPAATR
ncbi:MAG: MFS transporter [Mycobacteriales bacterium]